MNSNDLIIKYKDSSLYFCLGKAILLFAISKKFKPNELFFVIFIIWGMVYLVNFIRMILAHKIYAIKSSGKLLIPEYMSTIPLTELKHIISKIN